MEKCSLRLFAHISKRQIQLLHDSLRCTSQWVMRVTDVDQHDAVDLGCPVCSSRLVCMVAEDVSERCFTSFVEVRLQKSTGRGVRHFAMRPLRHCALVVFLCGPSVLESDPRSDQPHTAALSKWNCELESPDWLLPRVVRIQHGQAAMIVGASLSTFEGHQRRCPIRNSVVKKDAEFLYLSYSNYLSKLFNCTCLKI